MNRLKDSKLNNYYALATAGGGAALAIFILLALENNIQQPLLMAPFGASCVLLFLLPQSPLSQVRNVIGGHALSTSVGLLFVFLTRVLFPEETQLEMNIAIALSVGVSIILMGLFNVVHPPAGADPIVALLAHQSSVFLFFPVLTGAVLLVLIAFFQQKLINKLNKLNPTNY